MSDELRLEMPCHICDGTGDDPDPAKAKAYACPNCRGQKVVLTELGEKVLEFVGRHFRLGDASFARGHRHYTEGHQR